MADTNYLLLIHGGCGTILPGHMTKEKEVAYREALHASLQAGEAILMANGTAVEAVEMAVKILEDSPLFNAGKGAVFTHEGTQEMDASIMDGYNLHAGAVAGVGRIKNPIVAARQVMEHSPHVLLTGRGAEEFAAGQGCILEEAAYFYDEARFQQLQRAQLEEQVLLDHTGADKVRAAHMDPDEHKLGTVGAVALDKKGNVAAATSTGGMTNKRYGRIGDTPIIGAGTYANNATCAVSGTGHGEYFMRNVSAYDVSALMEYRQLPLTRAADLVINHKLRGEGGLIAVDARGNFALPFNTPGMYRGVVGKAQPLQVAIFRREDMEGVRQLEG